MAIVMNASSRFYLVLVVSSIWPSHLPTHMCCSVLLPGQQPVLRSLLNSQILNGLCALFVINELRIQIEIDCFEITPSFDPSYFLMATSVWLLGIEKKKKKNYEKL